MTKSLWNSLLVSPAIFTAMLVMGATLPAGANPTPEQTTHSESIWVAATPSAGSNNTMAQVTSVSQLSDVQPTD